MDSYKITPIPSSLAQKVHMDKHYLHRRASCSYAFGLYKDERLIGVILYGSPASANVTRGICGAEEAKNVIELTRLWIEDGTEKNVESYLIGNTIPLVPKEIIISYAEAGVGHIGTVYQATNWLYTGLTAKRTNWSFGVEGKHNRSFTAKYSAAELREKFGETFKLVDRPRKHRYIYFNATKKRRKDLLGKLRYTIEPYPKKSFAVEVSSGTRFTSGE